LDQKTRSSLHAAWTGRRTWGQKPLGISTRPEA